MTEARPRDPRGPAIRLDLIVAILLATGLSICWSITDWPRLSRLMLPDPDDAMRLLQVRDWIAGQAINDWTQYRMAPPAGALMHWSRINDFGIAAIILAATPFVGRHYAELTAVLLYPAVLFACALFLSARIGRRLWGPGAGPIAAVLTALAFPGTTIFIPGRIDHHALQAVLIQLLVLLLMRQPSARTGLIAGAVAAVSLVVGLESAPQVVAVIAVAFFGWVAGQPAAGERMAGFAAALAGATLLFLLFLRPSFWSSEFCDAFTPASATGTLAGAVALGLLVALHPVLRNWRWRLGAGIALGGLALGATLFAYPGCINGPYGAVDPLLLTLFYPHIVEANGVFEQNGVASMLAVGGLVAMACAVSVWMVAREPKRWPVFAPIVTTLAISALVMLVQSRGAYIGAPLAAPVLAGLILAARRAPRWRLAALAGAWLASAGLVYLRLPQEVGALFDRPRASDVLSVQVACTVGDTWSEVDRYPAGTVMAGTNVAGYLIASTRHSTIGAGYHRNNVGNMAVYRFYLGTPDQARAIAAHWRVGYVIFCPADFDEVEVGTAFPHSMAASLKANRPPAWLEPLPLANTPLRLYRIVR
ncbi:hypothetical protein [Sphingomonas psychrotolerans]|uniref:AcrB/AcrD/AcrF family protein n=1 Tax=Sphingomonas psychrotolerans TaxID=1327635 RepID=A0A2K8MJ18_9SPHN|nr:hypothetical protein [Sphingomonas psychrotolerans]ATY33853.1 hypothetical protein CVN68_19390 [Sphingomonas psychrotolerans]